VVSESERIYVGCATWAIGEANTHLLPPGRGNLGRYAQRLTAAEVNSSFHRSHRPTTWARWAASVGPSFRFSVKVPKTVTHERRLAGVEGLVAAFLEEIAPLGPKLGPLLVQLPPSFAWDARVVAAFLDLLAGRAVVVEPRHASWFDDDVDAFLAERRIARVAADPAVVPRAADPGGWDGLRYFRLHGAPVTYRSPYSDAFLDALTARLEPGDWCVFDNTASGAALPNAVALMSRLRAR
jgi:uncharacterized protein YecE (DUF72 family)